MEQEFTDLIKRFEAGQTYLDSYEIIHDFVALIKRMTGVEDYLQQEADKIYQQKLEIRQKKKEYDENYGIEFRDNALRVLHQMDIGFQYRQLIDVYWALESDDIFERDWLYRRRKPDDLISELDKREYLLYLQKVFKKIKPLLNGKDEEKSLLSFDESKSILCLRGQEIKIARHDRKTNEHKILKYIFVDRADSIGDDFPYAEIAMDEFGEDKDDYKNKNGWKRYYCACGEIQEKIRKGTTERIDDFLQYNSGTTGHVKINPKYLP